MPSTTMSILLASAFALLSSASPLTKRTVDPTSPFKLTATDAYSNTVTLCPINTHEGWIIGDYCFPDREDFTWTLNAGALQGVYNATNYWTPSLNPADVGLDGTYVALVGAGAPVGDLGLEQATDGADFNELIVTDAPNENNKADFWLCSPLGGAEYGRVLTWRFEPGEGTPLQNGNCAYQVVSAKNI